MGRKLFVCDGREYAHVRGEAGPRQGRVLNDEMASHPAGLLLPGREV